MNLITIVAVLIWIVALVVNGIACQIMINAAKKKGHYHNGGKGFLDSEAALWVIALLSPLGIIAVGMITASLPDLKLQQNSGGNVPVDDELPSL